MTHIPDDAVIDFDLRRAYIEVALGRAPAMPEAIDLRILATLVNGGTVPDEYLMPTKLGVRHLPREQLAPTMAAKLRGRAEELGVSRIVALEHDLLPVVAGMVARGVGIDEVAWADLCAARGRALADKKAAIVRCLGVRDPSDQRAVLRALRARGVEAVGVGKGALAAFRGREDVEAVIAHSRLAAFCSDVGPKVPALVRRERDRRLRADIDPLGTVTGRFTTTRPNLLGLEKSDLVRGCVVASPGCVLVSTDVKAAELRVLAAIAEEGILIEAFHRGLDPHRLTAARVFGVTENGVTDRQRNLGKQANFMIVFGGGALAIQQACAEARMPITWDDAVALHEGFLRAYPRVAEWLSTEGKDLSIARSVSGRIRTFSVPDVPAWLNAPVQMTAADAIKYALVAVAKELPQFKAHLLLCIHDELLVEAPVAVAQRVAEVVRACVVDAFEDTVGGGVPFEVAQSYGPTWASRDATWTWSPKPLVPGAQEAT